MKTRPQSNADGKRSEPRTVPSRSPANGNRPLALVEAARTAARAPALQTPSASWAEFSRADDEDSWRVINDTVMGGQSRSVFRVLEGRGIFAGRLSQANNGGFASVRTQVPPGLAAGAREIRIRARGDGKTYQFRVRTDERWDGPSHSHPFETIAGDWLEITLPVAAFRGAYRGRLVDVPRLVPASIRQIGFLVAGGQLGDFALELDWIRAIR